MKAIFFILVLPCIMAFLPVRFALAKSAELRKAIILAKANQTLTDSISQLLVVYNESPDGCFGMLLAMEKRNNQWVSVFLPMPVGLGRKGFAAPGTKREGDEKSPTGFFRLGQLFCYEKEVNTRMPYIQTTPEDKWIDDPDSPDYNRFIRGATSAKSYEKLLLNGNDYRYCMVIEYNTNPVVKGNGSAIFMHLSESEILNFSSGCVVLLHKDMEQLLRWMKPELKPSILMGNEKILKSGLKKRNLQPE